MSFLTHMMNSLLNPYCVVDNRNTKWGVNVAYTRWHDVLFQDQMFSWDASQLTQPYLGLITQREWRLRIRLEDLAKVTNFEIVKYNPSQYKDIRITVPAKSLRATKLSDGTYAPSGDNYWLLQNEFGTFGHVWLDISEGWNYMPCVDMSIYIDDVFQKAFDDIEYCADGFYFIICLNSGERIGSVSTFPNENNSQYDSC